MTVINLHVRAELTSNSLLADVISFAASELVPACFVGEGRAETDHYVFISRFRPRLSIYTTIRTSARALQNTGDQATPRFLSDGTNRRYKLAK